MEFIKFDVDKCTLCGLCAEKCPFGALTIEGGGDRCGRQLPHVRTLCPPLSGARH